MRKKLGLADKGMHLRVWRAADTRRIKRRIAIFSTPNLSIPTLEIVKTALVGIFELNIAIIQRGILGGCLFVL